MAIALTTIRTNVYTTLYNHLQTGTYATTSSNIHPSSNDEQLRSEGYPQIIIKDILISESSITMGSTLPLIDIPISVTIEVQHNSAANVRTIADEVSSKFRGAGKVFLKTVGLNKIKFESDDFESIWWGSKRTHYIYRLIFTASYTNTS